eukprot:166855_1
MCASTNLVLIIILNLFILSNCGALKSKNGNVLLSLNSVSTNNGTLVHFMTTKQRRALLNAKWGIWQTTNATLPRYDLGMACGHHNGSIFFIGGQNNPRQLVEYNIIEDKMIDYGTQVIPNYEVFITIGGGQYYVQLNHIIYMIGRSITLTTFNLETKIFTENWANVTLESNSEGSCIASWNDYLFVIGGDSYAIFDTTQILKTSSLEWLANTPRLNVARGYLACVVNPSNDKLFAMAGYNGAYLNSIEVLLIDINNIETSTWQFNGDNLLHAMQGAISVLFRDDIYVIGGSAAVGQNVITEVSVINTVTGQVTSGGHLLSGGIEYAAAIELNAMIYVFPGHLNGGLSGQYVDLTPTDTPSAAPSTAPTNAPTRYPTTIDAYSQIIAVAYGYHELEKTNIDGVINLIDNIIVILEDSYVELSKLYADNDDEVLYYKQFQITMTERDIEQNYDNNSVIITSSINYEEAFVGNTIIFISKKSFI